MGEEGQQRFKKFPSEISCGREGVGQKNITSQHQIFLNNEKKSNVVGGKRIKNLGGLFTKKNRLLVWMPSLTKLLFFLLSWLVNDE